MSDQADEETGGDSACWLVLVCPECGRVAEGRPAPLCAECGAEMPLR